MTTKPEPITRPNGSIYQPRKLRAFALNLDEEPVVLVLGTHDADVAYPIARRELSSFFGTDPAALGSPRKVWRTQKLLRFEDGEPWYGYPDDPERGAAGVEFTVEYPQVRG